jgi:mortality factor 4-like protein 1
MSQPFTINERVLCYHGPLIYEAKILKSEVWDDTSTRTGEVGPHYFVHYRGWKQSYAPQPHCCRLMLYLPSKMG